ncbi:hypothetical protein HRbin31_00809 [bacterium HR31]|nr:hypothetical protein HRbin31_00809 [bacterium HR31]
MADPFLRPRLAQQAQKRLPFQVQKVLLVHAAPLGHVAPGEHVRQLAADVLVVLRDVPGHPQVVQPRAQGGPHPLPAHPDRTPQGRPVTGADQGEGHFLGVRHQAVRVEGDPVAGTQEAELAALLRGGSHPGGGHQLEGPPQQGEQVPSHLFREALGHPCGHLFNPAAGGDQPHGRLHQPHIGLHGRLHPARVQRQLAAASQGAPVGRHHHGFGEVFDGLVELLEGPHRQVQLLPVPLLGLHEEQDQVGARGEVRALVGHHHRLEPALRLPQGLVEHPDDVLADGVHLGVELHAQDPVPQVHQAGARVVGNHRSLGLALPEHEDPFGPPDRGVGPGSRLEHLQGSVGATVEGPAGVQDVPHQGRQIHAVGLQPLRHLPHAQGVPRLEGAHLPPEAPTQGAVHVHQVVGDLGDAAGRVHQYPGQHPPQEPARPVARVQDRLDPARPVLQVAHRFHGGQARPLARPVLQGPVIQGEDLTVRAAVETAPGLVSQPPAFQHGLHERGQPEGLPLLVLRQPLVGVAGHVGQDVQPHQVRGPESRGPGTAEEGTRELVHLLDGQLLLHHDAHRVEEPEGGDAVRDEVGGVLAEHHPLSQDPARHVLHPPDDPWVGVGQRDQFQQPQVAGRVEEVGTEEVPAKSFGTAVGDLPHGQTRGVGAHHHAGSPEPLQPFQESLFDLEVLHHRLDDPVAVRDPVQVVLQVPYGHQLGPLRSRERRGPHLQGPFQAGPAETVADFRVAQGELPAPLLVGQLRGHDVQEQDGHAGVGQQRSQLAPHGPGSEDRRAADVPARHR